MYKIDRLPRGRWLTFDVLSEQCDAPSSDIMSAGTIGQTMKRAVDILVSLFALIILSPLLIIVALAVKMDSPGPAIFRQRRIGFHQEPFMILKFRTMSVMEDGPVVAQARRNDVRVTRLGKWLRATSIDELPQLINVLKGEMSLVGPRPHAEAHDTKFAGLISTYSQRSLAKPGITGWAQINRCRGETRTIEAMEARVDRDLWYIRNWSLRLDCIILISSIRVILDTADTY